LPKTHRPAEPGFGKKNIAAKVTFHKVATGLPDRFAKVRIPLKRDPAEIGRLLKRGLGQPYPVGKLAALERDRPLESRLAESEAVKKQGAAKSDGLLKLTPH
jgi:hypothetical protein